MDLKIFWLFGLGLIGLVSLLHTIFWKPATENEFKMKRTIVSWLISFFLLWVFSGFLAGMVIFLSSRPQ